MIEVDPDWWKDLFDEVYLMADARSVCDPELTRKEADLFIEAARIEPGHRLLDMCGGHGRHSIELASRGCRSCAVLDYSQTLLERGRAEARERGLEIEFIRADARRTGLPDKSFDRVMILGNSLGYAAEPEADLMMLCEANRLLVSGGIIILDVTDGDFIKAEFKPNAWHEADDVVVCRQREILDGMVRAREMVMKKDRGMIRDATYQVRLYSRKELESLLEDSGFTGVATRELSRKTDGKDYGFMNNRIVATAQKK